MRAQIPIAHGRCLYSDKRHKALFGGRGSAKSWSVATYLVVEACKRRLKIVCARQFMNAIRDSSKELIERRIRDLGLSDEFIITNQSILHRETGSEFTFVGLERNIDSIRSQEGIDIIWVEEARNVSKRSMEVLLPTVRERDSQMIWTWNPEQSEDPVDAYFRGRNPPDNAIVTHVDFRDNPFFAETAMPAEMEKLKRDNFARYRHIWLGEYDENYDSRVFTNFMTGRPASMLTGAPCYGLDFGSSNDPTAAVKVYFIAESNELYVASELYVHGAPITLLPELLDSLVHDRSDLVRADGSWPQTIEYLQSKRFAVRAATKGPGSVNEGLNFLRAFTRILVDPSCENMRRELHGYSWRTERLTGKVINDANPVGVGDHLIDALRYAVEDLRPSVASPGDDADDDGGVIRIPMWRSSRDPREERWHLRGRRLS